MNLNSNITTAFKEGKHQEALQTLYKTVLPKVRSYVLKNNGNADDGNDIFQDAVVILFKQIKSNELDIKQSVEGYLFTISRNLWINKAKRDARTDYREEVPEQDIVSDNVLGKLISKEREESIKHVFSQLGQKCAQLLKYIFYDGYSLAEVADLMEFSSAEVAHTSNYRCKKKLIALVGDNKELKKTLKESE